jgi:hypothetical protein
MGVYDLRVSGSTTVVEVVAEVALPAVAPEDEPAPLDISTIGVKKRNGRRSKNV